jgi:hypothetical protein
MKRRVTNVVTTIDIGTGKEFPEQLWAVLVRQKVL